MTADPTKLLTISERYIHDRIHNLVGDPLPVHARLDQLTPYALTYAMCATITITFDWDPDTIGALAARFDVLGVKDPVTVAAALADGIATFLTNPAGGMELGLGVPERGAVLCLFELAATALEAAHTDTTVDAALAGITAAISDAGVIAGASFISFPHIDPHIVQGPCPCASGQQYRHCHLEPLLEALDGTHYLVTIDSYSPDAGDTTAAIPVLVIEPHDGTHRTGPITDLLGGLRSAHGCTLTWAGYRLPHGNVHAIGHVTCTGPDGQPHSMTFSLPLWKMRDLATQLVEQPHACIALMSAHDYLICMTGDDPTAHVAMVAVTDFDADTLRTLLEL